MPEVVPGGDVVVLGGGITGLAAAHRLVQTVPGSHVTVIEAEQRLGGKIATERVGDFVIEAGPDSFLSSKPRGVGLSEELGISGDLSEITPRPHRAFVRFQGRLHDLPEGLSGLVPTRLLPLARSTLLSPSGKARVALDYVLPPRSGDADESLGGFVRRRLGREAWERLVEPLMAGIYAADGDRLSLAATFPQLREAERRHGGLIRGVLAARRAAQSASATPRSAFLTPKGGLSELVAALETRLRAAGVCLRTGVTARSVTRAASGYTIQFDEGESVRADAVIVATPAFAAADLLEGLDDMLARELRAIPYVSSAIVTLAYPHEEIPHPLDGHGYVVPRVEGRPILACTWSSRKWAHRAPDGWELIRVFLGRSGQLQEEILNADDALLVALARQEVSVLLGIEATPSLTRVSRWPRGMPQYHLGHPDRLARLEAKTRAYPGLFLAGSAYHGVGLPDCIASGERAAEAVAAHLRTNGDSIAAAALVRASPQGD